MDFEVKQVFYSYGDVLALDGISFSVNRGQIVGLVGENGAGKSTIVKNIYRYLKPDSGTITLDGKDIFSYPSDAYPVSYIPDIPVFYEELSSQLSHKQTTPTLNHCNEKQEEKKKH